jgi:hypothetical protein
LIILTAVVWQLNWQKYCPETAPEK